MGWEKTGLAIWIDRKLISIHSLLLIFPNWAFRDKLTKFYLSVFHHGLRKISLDFSRLTKNCCSLFHIAWENFTYYTRKFSYCLPKYFKKFRVSPKMSAKTFIPLLHSPHQVPPEIKMAAPYFSTLIDTDSRGMSGLLEPSFSLSFSWSIQD